MIHAPEHWKERAVKEVQSPTHDSRTLNKKTTVSVRLEATIDPK